MKNYEKPIILKNEELAEGVYAASGDCMYAEIHNLRYDGDNTMRFGVWYQHRASNDHCATSTYITLGFDTPVALSDTNGYTTTMSADRLQAKILVANELHSDGDCQTEFNIVGKAINGTKANVWVIGCDDSDFRIVDDHIKN